MLYIMRYDINDTYIKIGRTFNIKQRIKSLEASHYFRVIVLKEFHDKGHLESKVHDLLNEFRVTTGVGREWFKVSVEFAIKTINMVIAAERA